MRTDFFLRKAGISDAPELNKLYQNTILSVNRKDYSQEETEDWASCGNSLQNSEDSIANQYFIVAENKNKQIVGFSSIRQDGYLHTMFIHKDYQRQGIASLLYKQIEKYALENDIKRITSEVSITAKGFFEKQGFTVDEKQKRKANKLALTNYKMSKRLNIQIQQAQQADYPQIMAIWESAVRATHDFLKQEDFDFYKRMIPGFFNHVDLYILNTEKDIVAFIGISGDNLEMLFVSDKQRGLGYGKRLLEYAISTLYIKRVDVNEQNKQAIGFYEKFGFKVITRSEKDSMGKDYPILHMSL